ncbi:MAG: ABC transporter substrate-binding protein [Nitrospinae bacterium]|nr:ABC transporter substrate-binding protein [Nitrospinota bacterium]
MPFTRRSFLTAASTWSLGGFLPRMGWSTAGSAAAQQLTPRLVRIAHLSHRGGQLAEMASYAIMGAQLGAEEANVTAGMFGTSVELILEEVTGAEQVVQTARKLSAQPNLVAIIAALDDRSTAVLSDAAQQHRVVLLNAAARGADLRGGKCHRYTFHVEADLAMYAHAMGQWLFQNNRKRWYFIAAEDPVGQEVYQKATRVLQAGGGVELGRSISLRGQRDYKPVLGNLGKVNAEAIFVALMGEDLVRFLGQFQESGLPALVAGAPLDMPALWNADPASLTGVWATAWYHQFERFSARELNRRFRRRFGKPMEGYAWANWAAVKLVVEGVLRGASTDPGALVKYLEGSPAFDGHKGKALTFRAWNHQLRQPLYVVKARDSTPQNRWDLLEVVAELPSPGARGKSASDLLDTLGDSRAESSCHMEPF